jgi:predicted glycosyltransferase
MSNRTSPSVQRPKVWIDLDNTPHVPFFEPIVDELRARGFPVMLTARNAFQVRELAEKKGLNPVPVGRHYGKNRLMKVFGVIYRAVQLAPCIARGRPALAVSHGARSQILLSSWAGIPSLLLEDYEHSRYPLMMRADWVIVPEAIPDSSLPFRPRVLRRYPGLKEDVYAWKLQPDPQILRDLDIPDSAIVISVRPPATEALYHERDSMVLFASFMERACRLPETRIILLPRNQQQEHLMRNTWPHWFDKGRVVIPVGVLDGLNLIWNSDLVVGGGGTMTREAAALRVPSYSVFRGNAGAVDASLEREGRLILIRTEEDVKSRIRIAKRPKDRPQVNASPPGLLSIVRTIEEALQAAPS